jgi:quinol monooxygenase YgiN
MAHESSASSTLVQSIRYTFAPEDADRAAEILGELRELTVAESGVVRFDVARSRERPHVFVLWEVYRDEAALAEHMNTPHFQRLAVGGVRRLAKERVAELALPLD